MHQFGKALAAYLLWQSGWSAASNACRLSSLFRRAFSAAGLLRGAHKGNEGAGGGVVLEKAGCVGMKGQ